MIPHNSISRAGAAVAAIRPKTFPGTSHDRLPIRFRLAVSRRCKVTRYFVQFPMSSAVTRTPSGPHEKRSKPFRLCVPGQTWRYGCWNDEDQRGNRRRCPGTGGRSIAGRCKPVYQTKEWPDCRAERGLLCGWGFDHRLFRSRWDSRIVKCSLRRSAVVGHRKLFPNGKSRILCRRAAPIT